MDVDDAIMTLNMIEDGDVTPGTGLNSIIEAAASCVEQRAAS